MTGVLQALRVAAVLCFLGAVACAADLGLNGLVSPAGLAVMGVFLAGHALMVRQIFRR